MKHNRNLFLLAAIALTVFATACGDIDLGEAPPPEPVLLALNTTTTWDFDTWTDASSDAPEVVTAEVNAQGHLVFTAVAEGAALVTIADADGTLDLEFEVRPVANRVIQALPGGGHGLPSTVRGEGVTLLPGAELQLRYLLLDADSNRLDGDVEIDWQTQGDVTVLLNPRRRHIIVTAGEELGTFELLAKDAEPMSLEIVSEDAVDRIAIHNGAGELDAPVRLHTGNGAAGCHLAAWLADGRYVQGAGSAWMEVQIGDENVATAELAMQDDELPWSPEGKQWNEHVRGIAVTPQSPGSTTMTVTWNGLTAEVPVQVTNPE